MRLAHPPRYGFEPLETRTLLSGVKAFDLGGGADEVALQPDGKAVVSGSTRNGFRLARFNNDATLDTSFGNRGFVPLDFRPRAIEIQPDGKVLLVGGNDVITLARFKANGTPDTSFSGDGRANFLRGVGARGNALALQRDGKILAAGRARGAAGGDFAVLRLNPNGTLDKTFGGGDGVALTDFGGAPADAVLGLGVLTNGRIVAGGVTAEGRYALARYLPDSSLDPSLSSDGRVIGLIETAGGTTYTATDFGLFPDGTGVFYGEEPAFATLFHLDATGSPIASKNGGIFFQMNPNDHLATEGYDVQFNLTNDDQNVETPEGIPGSDRDFAVFGLLDFGGNDPNGREWSEFAHGVAIRDGVGAVVGITGDRWGIQIVDRKMTQGPFRGAPFAVNQKIQAEDFDHGGQGVAYNDKGPLNNGKAYRTSRVDVGPGGSAHVVGFTAASEWLEYSVDLPTGGIYRLDLALANKDPGGSLHLESEGINKSGAIAVPDNNSFSKMTVVSRGGIQLDQGPQVLRLAFDKAASNGAAGNVDWFRLVRTAQPDTRAPTAPPNVRVSARTNDSITVAWNASTDDQAVHHYKVYRDGRFLARLGANQRSFTFKGTAADPRLSTYDFSVAAFDATGNRSPLSHVLATRLTPPGEQRRFRLFSLDRIDAENFDLGGEGVAYHDTDGINRGVGTALRAEYAVDVGFAPRGGINVSGDPNQVVGFTATSEWLEYTIDVRSEQAGAYRLDVRLSNAAAGGQVHFELDGENVTGAIDVPNTGGFNKYTTVSGGTVNLTQGTHVIRLAFDKTASNNAVANLDWFGFVKPA